MKRGFSPIRVHPSSSVVGSCWLRLGRATPYRCFASYTLPGDGRCRTVGPVDALPNTIRRYGRLKICATVQLQWHGRPIRCCGERVNRFLRGGPPEPSDFHCVKRCRCAILRQGELKNCSRRRQEADLGAKKQFRLVTSAATALATMLELALQMRPGSAFLSCSALWLSSVFCPYVERAQAVSVSLDRAEMAEGLGRTTNLPRVESG